MASFNVTGLEDLERLLISREQGVSEAAIAALEAGAAVLVEAQQAEAARMFTGERSTGDLAKSIKASKVMGGETEKHIEVYPHGKDRHGVSNATKGAVQQYGRSNMPARPYMTVANEKSRDTVTETMRRAWEEKQNGG